MFRLISRSLLSFGAAMMMLAVVAVPCPSALALEATEVAKLVANDPASQDLFGFGVAVDGDTAVIGAYSHDGSATDAGAAYVFVRSGDTWVEQDKLLASDGASWDWFGRAVALAGDTALIGAIGDDDTAYDSGAVYVFMRSGETWIEQGKLLASDGAAGDYFGSAVALVGDTALVAANLHDGSAPNAGAAYVFVRSGDTWVEQDKLLASDGAGQDNFGQSVAVYGDTAVIGANLHDGSAPDAGAAYVFVRSGDTWVEQDKLLASDGVEQDQFGEAVAVYGDTAVIGAYSHDGSAPDAGAAYVFVRIGDTWVEQGKLLASDGSSWDYFGDAVALAGDTAVIGAGYGYGNVDWSGTAYLFVRSGDTWVEQDKLLASDGAGQDNFGRAVALAGDTAVIGAYGSGAAYIFSLLSSATPPGENVVVQPPLVDAYGEPIEDAPGISFTFEDVLTGGDTTVVVTEPGAGTTSAPSGFRITGLTGAPVLFDINTTATLAEGSTFEVCFDYSAMDVAGQAANLTLAHEVDGEWFDITSSHDLTNRIICGITDSFSYFAILELLEIVGPTDPLAIGIEALLGMDIGDPALTDTVRWYWGDGFSTDVAVATAELLTGHTYSAAGVYTVTASLLVNGVEAGSAEFQYVVVYDPSAGFVTGGGWIDSPEGTYPADPGLLGKATFGFVSKYLKGAIVPSGNTEFQFKAGDLNFRSSLYEWLVIAGARAQFKGSGTINGAGNFGFMLKVVDAALTPSTDVDLFRIKIWDKDVSDAVVYDNGLGAADDSDPTTAIAGGSIVIHQAKSK
jgi:hypothetical protein